MKPLRIAIGLILVVLLSACGSKKAVVANSGNVYQKETSKAPERPTSKEERAIYDEACSWLGVPYRYGGTTHQGVDCSGLTMNIYENALNIKIPRSSLDQKEACQCVDKKKLEIGDLVFFATGKDRGKVSHVGMYMGDGKMIHASSSRGVVMVDLESPYFANHFTEAGRVKSSRQETNHETKKSTQTAKPQPQETRPASTEYRTAQNLPKRVREGKTDRDKVLNSLIEQKLDSILIN